MLLVLYPIFMFKIVLQYCSKSIYDAILSYSESDVAENNHYKEIIIMNEKGYKCCICGKQAECAEEYANFGVSFGCSGTDHRFYCK